MHFWEKTVGYRTYIPSRPYKAIIIEQMENCRRGGVFLILPSQREVLALFLCFAKYWVPRAVTSPSSFRQWIFFVGKSLEAPVHCCGDLNAAQNLPQVRQVLNNWWWKSKSRSFFCEIKKPLDKLQAAVYNISVKRLCIKRLPSV